MDVTRILEGDHRRVEALIALLDARGSSDRAELVPELDRVLRAHMELEEAVLYGVMAPVVGESIPAECDAEHVLVRSGLDGIMALAPDGPGFGAALDAFAAVIRHHVVDEEVDVFPTLRAKGEALLDDIAVAFVTKRAEVGLPVTAEDLVLASSRAELVEQAQALGLPGASSMTKPELVDALVAAEGEGPDTLTRAELFGRDPA